MQHVFIMTIGELSRFKSWCREDLSTASSFSDDRAAWDEKDGRKALTWKRYLVGLLVIFAASYSQYFVPGINLMAGGFCVYGISIIVIGPLQGKSILRRAFRHSGIALRLGLGSFGIFTLLGMVASLLIVAILLDFDPAALNLLEKPVPVLHVPPRVASIMVWASLMVIGPCEEFIFRGFVFGGLLSLFGVRHWLALAFLSSVLFAAVHLYYLLTYGVASLVPFLDIVAVGMALAVTYYLSGGNLLVPALIHGAYDATGFMTVAVSSQVGLRLRGMLVLAGVVAAVVMVMRGRRERCEIHP
jgi:membrane protease YdiL (CAAX protease family)